MIRKAPATVLAVACGLAAAGCGAASGGESPPTLTVLAAASLTDAFTELGSGYERGHEGVRVVFSFAGSQQLAAQIRHGAPADVVATADQQTMDSLTRHVEQRQVFARNTLAIAVAPGNPKDVGGLADLGRRDLTVVLAAPDVPAGRYADQALAGADVEVRPASREPSVRAVLSRVQLGEADAGIVYATDVRPPGGSVGAVAVSDDVDVAATYPAAVVSSTRQPDRARAFVTWLRGEEAQTVLARYGFRSP